MTENEDADDFIDDLSPQEIGAVAVTKQTVDEMIDDMLNGIADALLEAGVFLRDLNRPDAGDDLAQVPRLWAFGDILQRTRRDLEAL